MVNENEAMEYVQSEDGRNAILNQLLERSESLARARTVSRLIDNTTFDQLTPEIWAQLVAVNTDFHALIDVVGQVIQESAKFLDDPDAVRLVVRVALKED